MSKPRNKPKHSFALLLLAAATPLLFGSQAQVTQTRQECIDSAWALYWNDRVGCDAQELNELNLCADEYNNAMAAADEIRDNALESCNDTRNSRMGTCDDEHADRLAAAATQEATDLQNCADARDNVAIPACDFAKSENTSRALGDKLAADTAAGRKLQEDSNICHANLLTAQQGCVGIDPFQIIACEFLAAQAHIACMSLADYYFDQAAEDAEADLQTALDDIDDEYDACTSTAHLAYDQCVIDAAATRENSENASTELHDTCKEGVESEYGPGGGCELTAHFEHGVAESLADQNHADCEESAEDGWSICEETASGALAIRLDACPTGE